MIDNELLLPSKRGRCGCNRTKCETCGRCPWCQCPHGGRSTPERQTRKAGRPRKKRKDTVQMKLSFAPAPRRGLRTLGATPNGSTQAEVATPNGSTQAEVVRPRTLFADVDKENVYLSNPAPLTIKRLQETLGLASSSTKNLSGFRHDAESFHDIDAQTKRSMIRFLHEVVQKAAKTLLPTHADDLVHQFLAGDREPSGIEQRCLQISDVLPSRSLQRRVCEALLCDAMPRHTLNDIAQREVPAQVYGKDRYARGRRDFQILSEGIDLSAARDTRTRFSELVADGYLDFVLNHDNIQAVSWGIKSIEVDSVVRQFPAIVRKRQIHKLWETYADQFAAESRVGKSSFNVLTRMLTASDQKIRRSIDYVTGQLVYDNFELAQSVLRSAIQDIHLRDSLVRASKQVENFLKYQYSRHIGTSVEATHSTWYALQAKSQQGVQMLPFSCVRCRSVFAFFAQVRDALSSPTLVHELAMIEECEKKTVLFMGHIMRQVNQKLRIGTIISELAAGQALVVLDFKMKFEPLYCRETTAQHFGKRGISWHGSCVRYRNENDEIVARYIDHIFHNDNKQDKLSILPIVEAVLVRIRRMLPSILSVKLQSDNASTYQNKFLPLFLSEIGRSAGVKIDGLTHTETQDGKSIVDAHFAVANSHVKSFCETGYNVSTPSELVVALRSGGGVSNSFAELLHIDREKLDEHQKRYDKISRLASKLLVRTNEIIYHGDLNDDTASIYEYSGMPAVSTLKLSIDHFGKCDYQCGEDPAVDGDADPEGHDEDNDADDRFEHADADETEPPTNSHVTVEETELVYPFSGARALRTSITFVNRPKKIVHKQQKTSSLEEDRSSGDCDVCSDCGRLFSSYPRMLQHKCKGPKVQADLVSYVLRKAYKKLSDGNLGVINVLDQPISLPETIEDPVLRFHFPVGWAGRPKHGEFYGEKRITRFKPMIKKMFDDGAADKSKKMSANQMRDALESANRGRFDTPSVSEIAPYISQLTQKAKREQKTAADTDGRVVTAQATAQRRAMDPEYAGALEELLAGRNYNVTRSYAIAYIHSKFPDAPALPTNDQIASKLYYIKGKHRKKVNLHG